MTGTLIFKKFISRADIRATFPTYIYLFGDNMKRVGMGGQAYSMRGEPNSFGVPTKWAPDSQEWAYFSDGDFPGPVERAIDFPMNLAFGWLSRDGTVVVPTDGLGTGLSGLTTRAPQIYNYIEYRLALLAKYATTINHED
jgi:hypothetical protein